jgi:hypothetical protein
MTAHLVTGLPLVDAGYFLRTTIVAMVDPDIQSTRIYVLFGFSDDLDSPRNDYLKKNPIKDATCGVTDQISHDVTVAHGGAYHSNRSKPSGKYARPHDTRRFSDESVRFHAR